MPLLGLVITLNVSLKSELHFGIAVPKRLSIMFPAETSLWSDE